MFIVLADPAILDNTATDFIAYKQLFESQVSFSSAV